MQMGFFFDQTRCSGCEACRLACRQWHGEADDAVDLLTVTEWESGRFPDVSVKWTVVPCLHCAEPLCAAACPAGVISKSPGDGIVTVDTEMCLGNGVCGAPCRDACPYGAPRFRNGPDAKMQKCELCLQRLSAGKKPICVDACPMRALDAGPLLELEAKGGTVRAVEGFRYAPEARPSVVFKAK